MSILIKDPYWGGNFYLKVKASDTIKEVRGKIKDQEGRTSNYLSFNCDVLEDSKTLGDCGIKDNFWLYNNFS